MNRRVFLQGLAAGTAGLLLPERKVWALDQTMVQPRSQYGLAPSGLFLRYVPEWMEMLEPIDVPLLTTLDYNYFQRMTFTWGTVPDTIVMPSRTAAQLVQWVQEEA